MNRPTNIALLIRQTAALSFEEFRDLIFRAKSLALLLMFVLTLFFIVWAIPSLNYSTQELNFDLLVFKLEAPRFNDLEGLLAQLALSDPSLAAKRIWETPSAFWLAQALLIGFYPLLLSLMSVDCVTRDIQRGTIRLVLCRTKRLVYFLSKTFAHFAAMLLLTALSLLTVVLVVLLKKEHPVDFDFFPVSLRYFLISIPYLLFCLALTLLVSTSCRRVKDALLRIQIVWTFFLLLTPLAMGLSAFSPGIALGFIMPFDGLAYHNALVNLSWAGALGIAAFWVLERKEV